MARWAMVIDLRRCVGCQACTISCQMGNDLPLGMFWNIVTTVGPKGSYPALSLYHIPSPLLIARAPYGQDMMQARQPMHLSVSTDTMPSSRCVEAPVGQHETQGG